MKKLYSFCLCAFFISSISGQVTPPKNPAAAKAPSGLSAIKTADLKKDLFTLASDSMRGKRAGTLDELKAAAWMAEQARKAGLEPAGDNGSYFQFFPLEREKVSEESKIKINGKDLKLWQEAWVRRPQPFSVKAPVVWFNSLSDTTQNVKGKVVAMNLLPPAKLPAEGMSLWVYRYALSSLRQQAEQLKNTGVQAIVLVADSIAESKIGFFGHGLEEGTYNLQSNRRGGSGNDIPLVLVGSQFEQELKKPAATFEGQVEVNTYIFPSANVVAKAPGTDQKLKNKYVLFSGHHDHDGVGVPVDGDSIWNGADDNASVSVALLAIGRAWKQNPPKRSALFVWHGAEERGLFGSRYYVQHPTVKKENIVAVLNGDMIGRNEPGKAALLGSIAPHKNSQELVDMAYAANEELTGFEIDTSWDEADHPENWYFRSDHLPYAQAGIPAIFFTTLLHPDYHTPEDEAEKIDLEKLTKMTKWMYGTGLRIANSPKAPALESQ